MGWEQTAEQLLDAFRTLRSSTPTSPPLYPHGWVLQSELNTYRSLRNLHGILCPRLDVLPGQQPFATNLPNEPCQHTKSPLQHPFKAFVGGPYTAPAVAQLAWQLAQELAVSGYAFARTDPLLQDVQSYVRDAADCD